MCFYNAQLDFTFQVQLLLAPVCFEDSWPVIIEKLNLTARFIDLLIMSRVIRYTSVNYSTIRNYVFNVTKHIRECDITTLKQRLLENALLNFPVDKISPILQNYL